MLIFHTLISMLFLTVLFFENTCHERDRGLQPEAEHILMNINVTLSYCPQILVFVFGTNPKLLYVLRCIPKILVIVELYTGRECLDNISLTGA